MPEAATDPRKFGYSRDRRSDCVQVVIAMVVTPEGLPLTYEVMLGNTTDRTTLTAMIALLKKRHAKMGRIWGIDRGIPTEDSLAQMRACDPPMHYHRFPRLSRAHVEGGRSAPDHISKLYLATSRRFRKDPFWELWLEMTNWPETERDQIAVGIFARPTRYDFI